MYRPITVIARVSMQLVSPGSQFPLEIGSGFSYNLVQSVDTMLYFEGMILTMITPGSPHCTIVLHYIHHLPLEMIVATDNVLRSRLISSPMVFRVRS